MTTQAEINETEKKLAHRRRRRNPTTAAAVVGTVALVAVGAATTYYIVDARRKAKKKKEKETEKPSTHRLSGVYALNATLGNSASVLESVWLPIVFAEAPMYRDPSTGEVGLLPEDLNAEASGVSGVLVNNRDVLGRLVTDLTASATSNLYEYMLYRVVQRNDDLSDPGMRKQAVDGALKALVHTTDWDRTYEADSPQAAVRAGADLLARIAYQSYWNRYEQEQGGPIDG